jgi:Protein of unknown function (DUF3108)
MRLGAALLLYCLGYGIAPASGQDFCGLRNTAFQPGENITYKVYYTLAGVYMPAGEVNFSCAVEPFEGRMVYHMLAKGKTFPFYDNFYKVRDQYESFIDTGSLLPYKFVRQVNEGDYKKYENIRFNKTGNTVITDKGVFKVPACVQDVLSAMYYARNINFDHSLPGEKIPFTMFLDNQLYPSYIRFVGREIIRTRYGTFHSIKFKPLLIKGTLFESGEKMTVWVSDDANHVPLRVESAIVVGNVKADMMDYHYLRAPLSSLIMTH